MWVLMNDAPQAAGQTQGSGHVGGGPRALWGALALQVMNSEGRACPWRCAARPWEAPGACDARLSKSVPRSQSLHSRSRLTDSKKRASIDTDRGAGS
jgi:hypothetical protein